MKISGDLVQLLFNLGVYMVELKVKIFADGADIDSMKALNDDDQVQGLTTNPSLMKKAGVKRLHCFLQECLKVCN